MTVPLLSLVTDGQGRFLYVSSAVQREGDVATVMTKAPFPASTGVCHLRFWYYMYGSRRMGALKVSGIPSKVLKEQGGCGFNPQLV